MADCKKCRFRSICKKRPTMEGATIAECDLFRDDIERTEPMTNADRIRAMSDEELAKYLLDVEQGNFTIDCCDDRFCDTEHCCNDCTSAAIKWLKRPAEEVR